MFEVNPDAIPSDTGVLQGALFSQCMVADYYVSRIGTSGNLYLVVLDNFELSDDVQCTPLEATRTESLLNHCVPTPERRRPLCASRVAVETADRCETLVYFGVYWLFIVCFEQVRALIRNSRAIARLKLLIATRAATVCTANAFATPMLLATPAIVKLLPLTLVLCRGGCCHCLSLCFNCFNNV